MPPVAAIRGVALKCKPGGPNDYIYVVVQAQVWGPLMKLIGREELIDHPDYATPGSASPPSG